MIECLEKVLKSMVSVKVRAYVKDYCKRNGLLTLSVIAVVTGCVLGFLLRSLNLSTQVWMKGWIRMDGWMDGRQYVIVIVDADRSRKSGITGD